MTHVSSHLQTCYFERSYFYSMKEKSVTISLPVNADNLPAAQHDLNGLIEAIRENQLEAVKSFLEGGVDVEARGSMGWGPIHFAAHDGRTEMLKLLISRAPSLLNSTTSEGLAPLHLAAGNGHEEAVSFLLEQRAICDVQDSKGWSAAHYAAYEGHAGVLKSLLVEKPSLFELKTLEGFTPLHLATIKGSSEAVFCLLEQGAAPGALDNQGSNPLHYAAEKGNLEVVQALLDKQSNLVHLKGSKQQLTPLHIAAGNGHLDVVEYLHNAGAILNDRDSKGWGAIHYAARKGDQKTLGYLILQDPSLLESKTREKLTPLYIAAKREHTETVKFLLDHQADSRVQDINGWSVVHYLAHKGNVNILELFISKFPESVDIKGPEQLTPIDFAAQNAQARAVEYLLDQGANPNAPGIDGWCLIHRVVSRGNRQILEALIKKQPTLAHSKGPQGITPLHVAAAKGLVELTVYLLDQGADPQAQDAHGLRAVDYAVKKKYQAVTELLVQKSRDLPG